MINKILFIQTGGTIDKDYPHTKAGYAFEFGTEPAIKSVLKRANVNFDYEIITVFCKDSQDITSDDRKSLIEIISNSQISRIVITHGSDTIIETAGFLSVIKEKTIVLTAAFLPEKFKNSDADFNSGMAVAAVSLLSPGIYIAINGEIFKWDNVKRNEKGMFLTNE